MENNIAARKRFRAAYSRLRTEFQATSEYSLTDCIRYLRMQGHPAAIALAARRAAAFPVRKPGLAAFCAGSASGRWLYQWWGAR